MKLIFTNENRSIEIPPGGSMIIGRQDGVDIRIPDKRVSRHHAEITEQNGMVFIHDLGSRAGTKKNGVAVTGKTQLNPGDVLKIADFEFVVRPSSASTRTAVAISKQGNEQSVSAPKPADPAPPVTQSIPAPPDSGHALPLYSAQKEQQSLFSKNMMTLSKRVQTRVLELLNVGKDTPNSLSSASMRPQVESALDQILREIHHEIPPDVNMSLLRQTLLDNLIGLGPLSPLLRDASISEIMINGPNNIFIESKGLQYRTASKFHDEGHLQSIIQRIVEPLGRHIDAASPMVDARLEDGSRVNAVIPPLALDGSLVTIRKFPSKKLVAEDLEKFGSLTHAMTLFLKEAVRARRNILVSGGTGSGKTTLLNILSQFIPEKERVITVEDSAELKLTHENLCRLEARPANVEGQGRVTIRDLVINTLRMRPDRIIVGECRGPEALDMLQAMNTGHDGSMTTCHANTPRDALSRLENMVMMAGFELPSTAIREQIASAIHLIVQQTRLPDGSRKIVKISEVTGRENGVILMQDIFSFEQEGFDEKFHVIGHHTATGNIPRFIDELRQSGDLQLDMSVFVPES